MINIMDDSGGQEFGIDYTKEQIKETLHALNPQETWEEVDAKLEEKASLLLATQKEYEEKRKSLEGNYGKQAHLDWRRLDDVVSILGSKQLRCDGYGSFYNPDVSGYPFVNVKIGWVDENSNTLELLSHQLNGQGPNQPIQMDRLISSIGKGVKQLAVAN